MNSHHYIFLSPHFDDVALSCGGLVWSLTRRGHKAEVWTIMGGLPSSQDFSPFAQGMHQEWGMPPDEIVQTRQTEDQAACQVMGAHQRYFHWQDAIYREDPVTHQLRVNNNSELFGKPPEPHIIAEIADVIYEQVPQGAKLVCPISLGNHIDHRAVRQAGDLSDRVDLYYADYPYILTAFEGLSDGEEQWQQEPHQLTEDDLVTWQGAVLCYASQLSMFWRDAEQARLALRNYLAGGGGRFWRKSENPHHQ
jgi:LmbE family N-acetylglucosaminyl deacetylase